MELDRVIVAEIADLLGRLAAQSHRAEVRDHAHAMRVYLNGLLESEERRRGRVHPDV